MGIDIWDVIDAAKTKPFGFMPFYPGPGLGGHCIPIDPFYLSWRARAFEFDTKFIELAGEVNRAMPRIVVKALGEALCHALGHHSGARMLIMGVAYKKNIDDLRESPRLRIMEILQGFGADVSSTTPISRRSRDPRACLARRHEERALRRGDRLRLRRRHDHHRPRPRGLWRSRRWSKLVVDTRNATKAVFAREKIVLA